MSNENKAPTKEEFFTEVKRHFWKHWKSLSEKEVDEYLASEEAAFEIDNAYENNLEEFESGQINRKQFIGDGAFSVSYCLSLMY